MNTEHRTSYGVFKPVGHVLISFPVERDARDAEVSLQRIGIPETDIVHYSPDEMKRQFEADIAAADFLATVGQELNLVRAHHALAQRGSHFLLVLALDDRTIDEVTHVAIRCHAQRAQRYGRFIVEELVPVGDTARQVYETPHRGPDAQTQSGIEGNVHKKGGR
jgi:hypothetical protein